MRVQEILQKYKGQYKKTMKFYNLGKNKQVLRTI